MTDRTPYYEAVNAARYERQSLIQKYQEAHKCRLVVIKGPLFAQSIALLEETLIGAKQAEDLHVMLSTLGGDGETALRLVRQAQSRCKELTVVIPDQAKSAGTLFALGAHKIYMGPTSDLGPVDPQLIRPDGTLAAARAIIAAVEEAELRIRQYPNTYPLHASLLSDINALVVQQARDAIERTGSLVREALACTRENDEDAVEVLAEELQGPLVDESKHHGAIVSASDAKRYGLPVEIANPASARWKATWRLWMKYHARGARFVYEGEKASVVGPSHDQA